MLIGEKSLAFDMEFCDDTPLDSVFDPMDHAEFGLEHNIRTEKCVPEIPNTGLVFERPESLRFEGEQLKFGFRSQPKPWFSSRVLQKLNKLNKGNLRPKDFVILIEEMASVVVDFYQIRSGQAIAVRFNGQIVESAESEIELLSKIQGKDFGEPIFVWQVGSDSFSGWRT